MLIQLRNLAIALLALAFPTVAFAQSAPPAGGATPDLTPISNAVTSGVTQGIEVMLAIAPIVIAFAVVWGVINKSRRMAK